MASTNIKPDKSYLGTIGEDFKQRVCNHKKSFKNNTYGNDTAISKYVWNIKQKYNGTSVLKWHM